MGARFVPAILITLLVVLHAQLWFGRGSVPNVNRMAGELEAQKQKNTQAQLVNDRLLADIQDLREGLEMVEEKARLELGMVKPNEIYVQITK
ncbi:MAG: septum formation initiator family protein [Hylemonella sp.]